MKSKRHFSQIRLNLKRIPRPFIVAHLLVSTFTFSGCQSDTLTQEQAEKITNQNEARKLIKENIIQHVLPRVVQPDAQLKNELDLTPIFYSERAFLNHPADYLLRTEIRMICNSYSYSDNSEGTKLLLEKKIDKIMHFLSGKDFNPEPIFHNSLEKEPEFFPFRYNIYPVISKTQIEPFFRKNKQRVRITGIITILRIMEVLETFVPAKILIEYPSYVALNTALIDLGNSLKSTLLNQAEPIEEDILPVFTEDFLNRIFHELTQFVDAFVTDNLVTKAKAIAFYLELDDVDLDDVLEKTSFIKLAGMFVARYNDHELIVDTKQEDALVFQDLRAVKDEAWKKQLNWIHASFDEIQFRFSDSFKWADNANRIKTFCDTYIQEGTTIVNTITALKPQFGEDENLGTDLINVATSLSWIYNNAGVGPFPQSVAK